MNDPDVLSLFSQLLLFSNGPASPPSLEFKGTTVARRETLKALTAKLGLRFSYDSTSNCIDVARRSATKSPRAAFESYQNSAIKSALLTATTQSHQLPELPEQQTYFVEDSQNSVLPQMDSGNSLGRTCRHESDCQTDSGAQEIVFGTNTDGSLSEIKARHHAALKEELRARAKVLAGIGACWRCKILRKGVSVPSLYAYGMMILRLSSATPSNHATPVRNLKIEPCGKPWVVGVGL